MRQNTLARVVFHAFFGMMLAFFTFLGLSGCGSGTDPGEDLEYNWPERDAANKAFAEKYGLDTDCWSSAKAVDVQAFISPYVVEWKDGSVFWYFGGRECGGEGWTMIPERLQPCNGVTFYSRTDSDGKTTICSDVPPCDTLTQGQINAMYVWAVGTDDTPSD